MAALLPLLGGAACEAIPADHALVRETGKSLRRLPRRLDLQKLLYDPAHWAPLTGFAMFQDLKNGIGRLPTTLGLDREILPSASDPSRATGPVQQRRESLVERIALRLPL